MMRGFLRFLVLILYLVAPSVYALDFWADDFYWQRSPSSNKWLGFDRHSGELVHQFRRTSGPYESIVEHLGNVFHYDEHNIFRTNIVSGQESIFYSWSQSSQIEIHGLVPGRDDQLFAFDSSAIHWLDPLTGNLVGSMNFFSIRGLYYNSSNETLWALNTQNELLIVDVSADSFGTYTTTALDIQGEYFNTFTVLPSRNQILTSQGDLYNALNGRFIDRLTENVKQAHIVGNSLYVLNGKYNELIEFDDALIEQGRVPIATTYLSTFEFTDTGIAWAEWAALPSINSVAFYSMPYTSILEKPLFTPIEAPELGNSTLSEWDGNNQYWSYEKDEKILTEWDVSLSSPIQAWHSDREISGIVYLESSDELYITTVDGLLLKLTSSGEIIYVGLLPFSVEHLEVFEDWLIAERRSSTLKFEVLNVTGNIVPQTEDFSTFSIHYQDFSRTTGTYLFRYHDSITRQYNLAMAIIDPVTGVVQSPTTVQEDSFLFSHQFYISPSANYFYAPSLRLYSLQNTVPIIDKSFTSLSSFTWVNSDFYMVEWDGMSENQKTVITRLRAPSFNQPFMFKMNQKVVRLESNGEMLLAILESDSSNIFRVLNTENLPDSDSDGYHDYLDNCPLIVNPTQLNYDGDEQGDICDIDDDNDRIPDDVEIELGLNPKNFEDAIQDSDHDGYSNVAEYLYGGDLFNAAKLPFVIGSFNYDFNERNYAPLLQFSGVDSVRYYDVDLDSGLDLPGNRLILRRQSEGERYIEIEISGLFQEGEFYYDATFNQGSAQTQVYLDGEFHSSSSIPRGEHTLSVRWQYGCYRCTEQHDLYEILVKSVQFISSDRDDDTVRDNDDNCVAVPNASQANADGDVAGDVCDPWPDEFNSSDGPYSVQATTYWGDVDTDQDKVPDHAEFFLRTDINSSQDAPYRYQIRRDDIGNEYLAASVLYDWITYELPFYDDTDQDFAYTAIYPDSTMTFHTSFDQPVVMQFDIQFPNSSAQSCEFLQMYVDSEWYTAWSNFRFERFNLMLLPGKHEIDFKFSAKGTCSTVNDENLLYIYNVWLYSNSRLDVSEPLEKVNKRSKKGGSFGIGMLFWLALLLITASAKANNSSLCSKN